MLKKKMLKKRKKKTRRLKKLVDSKYMRKNPELQRMLKEMRLCYCVGANDAAHYMTVRFLEKLFEIEFPRLFESDSNLYRFLIDQRKQEVEKSEYPLTAHLNRQERNEDIQALQNSIELILNRELEIKDTIYSKEILKTLNEIDEIVRLVTK